MRKIYLCIYLLISANVFSQLKKPDPSYRVQQGSNIVAAKNYYLLSMMQQDLQVKALFEHDTVLTAVFTNSLERMSQSLAACKNDISCFSQAIQFSDSAITVIGSRLAMLYHPGNALDKLLQQHIIPSGTYVSFQQLTPQDLLVKAWEQDARGINFAIAVYAAGNKPNYPNIDSIAFNVKDNGYSRLLYSAVYTVVEECRGKKLFFLPQLTAALRFLELNEREQAADYEPMEKGENKLAVEALKKINWPGYKYTVILVPGAGPDQTTVALSAEGMLRCRLASLLYQQGLAPFIVVSGGRVHPYKTKYCEAVEMKNYLVEKLHVPANAVLIEPHARHTTTNMRNTARLIFRYGMPFEMPALTCTTRGQSNMIENTLIDRCIRELKAAPYKNGKRLSDTVVEFYPLIEALHINPSEPMDP